MKAVLPGLAAVFFVVHKMIRNRQYWLGLTLSVFLIWGYICCGQAMENEQIGLWLVEKLDEPDIREERAEAVGVVIRQTEKENFVEYLLKDVTIKTVAGTVRLQKLVVYVSDLTEIEEGDRIAVTGSLGSFEAATNPGGFDYRAYQTSFGVYLRLYGEKITLEEGEADPFLWMLGRIRKSAVAVFLEISPEVGGTMAAMVLGDKTNLPDERYELYLDTGIGHILTLSGLHLSLLGVGLHGVLRKRVTMSAWPAALTMTGLLLTYVNLIGSGISAVRAAVAMLCSLLAGCLGKTYDSLSAAGLGMLLILTVYPMQIRRPSFWLSFGAVIAMGWILPELNRFLKPKSGVTKALTSVLVIWLALMPVTAINQFVIQPYSILLNFLIIPMMGPVLVGCILALFVGMLSLPAAGRIASLIKLAFNGIDRLCELSQKLPGTEIAVGYPAFGQLVVYAAVLAIFLMIVSRKNRLEWERQEIEIYGETAVAQEQNRDVKTAGDKVPDKKAKPCLRWASLFLISVSLAAILILGIGRNRLEMYFLDVGQGDCIFIRMPDGTTMMVDGGSTSEEAVGEYRILPFLAWAGVDEIDYVVMTHLDRDHTSGLLELLEAGFPIRYLLVSNLIMEGSEVEKLGEIASKNGTIMVRVGENNRIICGKVEIECIAPDENLIPESENECSVVLDLTYGKFTCLLTGDVEGDGENAVEEYVREHGTYTVLKVAHHGSKYSTSAEFLQSVRPLAAVISCGEGNVYGHPHGELIDRLEAVDCEIFCTAECGAVLVSTDGIHLSIEGYAAQD